MTDADSATFDADTRLEPGGCAGGCACGETEAVRVPELADRPIPHAIGHPAILGATDGVASGDGLILVATNDPAGLLVQLQGSPDTFDVEYVESGPEARRLSLTREGRST